MNSLLKFLIHSFFLDIYIIHRTKFFSFVHLCIVYTNQMTDNHFRIHKRTHKTLKFVYPSLHTVRPFFLIKHFYVHSFLSLSMSPIAIIHKKNEQYHFTCIISVIDSCGIIYMMRWIYGYYIGTLSVMAHHIIRFFTIDISPQDT